MEWFKKVSKVVIAIAICLLGAWVIYGSYLYVKLDPFAVNGKTITGEPSKLFLQQSEAQSYNFPLDKDKKYMSVSALWMVLRPETRYFHDKKYRSDFLFPTLGFFTLLVKMEDYVLCSERLEKPIGFKTTSAGGQWFRTSGVGYDLDISNTADRYAIGRNILAIGAIEDYPLEISLIKGSSCEGKILKSYTLDYSVEKNALGGDSGILELKEKE